MKKIILWLDEHFEEFFLTIFLLGIVLSMTIHVFFRYVLKTPLVFTEELSRYLFIWFVFIGFSYGIKNSIHIRVNIIEEFFPSVIPVFGIIQDVVVTFFIVYMIPAGINVCKFFLRTGQKSPGLEVPMLLIYGSLMLGLLLSLIRIIQKWILRFKKGRKNISMKGVRE